MFRFSFLLLVISLQGHVFGHAQQPQRNDSSPSQEGRKEIQTDSATPTAMPRLREYRGVSLGLNRTDVKDKVGKPGRVEKDMDEYKLDNGDLMTVRYDDLGNVKTIQVYFINASHAPAWTEVINHPEIQSLPTGAKLARAVDNQEKFWITMFQNKDGSVTTITISR